MFKLNYKLILVLIVLLAASIRLIFSEQSPPSLNWDEASLGYNAYSILKTGKDEWGRVMPLTFEAFGDFKLPGYIYTAVPFIALFGLNELAIRLPSTVGGILAVIFIFLIVDSLTQKKNLSLLSALLFAISPWHIFLSRMAVEANLALTFFLGGLYFFIKGLKKPLFLIPSSFLFGITIFTYNSARVFIPLFVLSLVFIHRKKLLEIKTKLILPFLIVTAFVLLASFLAISKDSTARYYWVTLLDQGAINYLNEARNKSTLPDFVDAIIYNRATYFIKEAGINYLQHFSPIFLFIKGGDNYQFSVQQNGLFYILEFPFLIFGIYKVFRNKDINKLLLFWLFVSPIASSITRDSPHVLRAIFFLGVIPIFVSIGLYNLVILLPQSRYLKKIILGGIGLLYLLGFSDYTYQYFYLYPQKESRSWQYGIKEIYKSEIFQDYLNSGKKIFISKEYGEPHIFYLVYTKYEPKIYQNSLTLKRYESSNWRWIDRLDNLYFLNNPEVKDKTLNEKDALLITTPGNYPENARVVGSTYFLDESRAFDVVKL